MCSPHLLGLKHLHNTPTKSIPQPPQALASQPWPQETRPNYTANILTHTLWHPQTEKHNCSATALWWVETFFCLWRKGKAHQLLSYLSTHLPHYHLAWLLAAQLTNWSKLRKAFHYPAPSSCALLNNLFWLIYSSIKHLKFTQFFLKIAGLFLSE